MDVSELPVSKSGGPRVDVDALMAELEDSRLDASTTAGQLADAQRDALDASARSAAQVATLKAENDELRAKIDAMEQSYREARSMWPEGQTHRAWYDLVQAEKDRATAAEARLAAQQGALETLRGLLADAEVFAWHNTGCPGDIEDMPCLCGYLAWRDAEHAVFYPPVGRAPTGGETETR